MAAVAFDPLAYSHALEASGVSREQAEVHAKAMTAIFLHNVDALVTRDYLDTRFTEFENRVDANIDKRIAEFRLEMHGYIAELKGTQKLQSWMLVVVITGVFMPLVQGYLA